MASYKSLNESFMKNIRWQLTCLEDFFSFLTSHFETPNFHGPIREIPHLSNPASNGAQFSRHWYPLGCSEHYHAKQAVVGSKEIRGGRRHLPISSLKHCFSAPSATTSNINSGPAQTPCDKRALQPATQRSTNCPNSMDTESVLACLLIEIQSDGLISTLRECFCLWDNLSIKGSRTPSSGVKRARHRFEVGKYDWFLIMWFFLRP